MSQIIKFFTLNPRPDGASLSPSDFRTVSWQNKVKEALLFFCLGKIGENEHVTFQDLSPLHASVTKKMEQGCAGEAEMTMKSCRRENAHLRSLDNRENCAARDSGYHKHGGPTPWLKQRRSVWLCCEQMQRLCWVSGKKKQKKQAPELMKWGSQFSICCHVCVNLAQHQRQHQKGTHS